MLKLRELVRALKKLGVLEMRQRGSHLVMLNEAKNRQIIVPIHNKPLKKGTLAAILRQADVSECGRFD